MTKYEFYEERIESIKIYGEKRRGIEREDLPGWGQQILRGMDVVVRYAKNFTADEFGDRREAQGKRNLLLEAIRILGKLGNGGKEND